MHIAPQSMSEVIVVPLLGIFFGVAIWLAAWNRLRMYGEVPKWWWLTLLPLLLGAFVGWKYFQPFLNGVDRLIFEGDLPDVGRRRIIYSCYFGFIGPLVCALTVVAWALIQKRRSSSSPY